jgi:potassium-transporting ATPase KdpC subunit
MPGHLRANLLLVVLSLLICCVLYPLALLAVGQGLFRDQAEGSLVYGEDGKPVGSRLIAQAFSKDEYFQPRPSAVSYNAAASGASNWGANNYLLRDRVARALGPIVKYAGGPKKGQPVAPDIVTWFRKQKPGLVGEWAEAHSGLAQAWVKSEKNVTDKFVEEWAASHPADVGQWKKDNPDTSEPKAEDLAVAFFKSFAKENPGTWLTVTETKDARGESGKKVELVKDGDGDIPAVFFDLWRQEHAAADLEQVPADLVMASGSGLDPHITLKNALYQLERVAGKWAELTRQDEARLRQEIELLLRQKASAPLGGLAGVELVNVLEVNLELRSRYEKRATARPE